MDSWVNSTDETARSATEPNVAGESGSGADLHLELDGTGSRRDQLMRALRESIRSGRLTQGTRLPPYRSLATDLGIARNTVADAYAELVEEGWLTSKQGSGTRVAPRAVPLESERSRLSARRSPRRPTHDLQPSSPDAAAFPRSDWMRSARRAMTNASNEAFGVGDPRGRVELRDSLVDYLARARGVRTKPERIVICAGFAHGLRLLSTILDGAVAVESYGLAFHREIVSETGSPTVPLTIDEHGARVDEIPDSGSGTALLTPAHQYPTGGPLHPERRSAVIDWARSTGGLIIEDDYDGEFRYDREPVGALQGLDPERVVYMGSVSKSISPALRIGWMVLPERLVDDVLDVKGPRELSTGVTGQLTLADFVSFGAYERHLRRMRRVYRRRRDLLTGMIAERAPHIRVSGIAAGLHAVLELPPDTERMSVTAARRQSLELDGLNAYRHPDSTMPSREGLVVGYGTPPEHAFSGALEALCLALPEAPDGAD
ncbi:GntR family transcriptional regulator/MocR family aminotransferase [Actinopolyspora lacussalsi]|nr:GntR family transcriptional regulator/MocR family aminotransferase [Actinopolyspora lacussalsi]